MTEINKEQLVFTRGEDGSLLAQEVSLDSIDGKPSVKVVPLTRGKLQEIYQQATSTDMAEKVKADNEVIKVGLCSPKLTDEEIIDMKPQMATAITQAILSVSLGMSQEEISKKANDVVQNQEYLLKKN